MEPVLFFEQEILANELLETSDFFSNFDYLLIDYTASVESLIVGRKLEIEQLIFSNHNDVWVEMRRKKDVFAAEKNYNLYSKELIPTPAPHFRSSLTILGLSSSIIISYKGNT